MPMMPMPQQQQQIIMVPQAAPVAGDFSFTTQIEKKTHSKRGCISILQDKIIWKQRFS